MHLCRSAPDPSFPVFWHLRSPAPAVLLPGTAFVVHGSFFVHFICQIRFVGDKTVDERNQFVVILLVEHQPEMVGVMNKAVGEFLFCGGFGRWEALVLYGGDLWQIIYGCSSDYHDIVSSNLLSINFFLSISQLISFSGIVCVVVHNIFKEPSD